MHQGKWFRYFGSRLEDVTVGIIGMGRIGKGVLRRLKGFGTSKIMVNDLEPNYELDNEYKLEWTSKEQIFKENNYPPYQESTYSSDSYLHYNINSSSINTSDINLVSVDSVNGRRYL